MSSFEIQTGIDLHDVQGNVLKGYGRYGFPFARYVFYRVEGELSGRRFIQSLLPLITTATPWTRYGDVKQGTKKPKVTTNLAVTHSGLRRLGVPEQTLLGFPPEFTMGMRARTKILGDDGPSDPTQWDPIWCSDEHIQVVHLMITINAEDKKLLAKRYDEVTILLAGANMQETNHVVQVRGHRNAGTEDAEYQDAMAIGADTGKPGRKEHFGYTDGISDPYIKDSGSYPTYVAGGGKRVKGKSAASTDGWAPIATGEFLLGHVDEADEYPASAAPASFVKNGTFLVYRKLHQNVASFDAYVREEGARFGDPELFAAKLVGRWANGAPLSTFPTKESADTFIASIKAASLERNDKSKTDEERKQATQRYYDLKQRLMAFDYRDDIDGARCPVGAHARRVNPRGALNFGLEKAFGTPSAMTDRRRIARRGLPYGDSSKERRDDGDHGVIFMIVGSSIRRQFEFVQQQWANYGNDFRLANSRDPIIGNQPTGEGEGGEMVFQVGSTSEKPPFFCRPIPRFVETRGGDYFFVPGLRALANLAAGTVDPT